MSWYKVSRSVDALVPLGQDQLAGEEWKERRTREIMEGRRLIIVICCEESKDKIVPCTLADCKAF